MRLERKSLLACTLLLLTGCSAARHFRSAASEDVSPDRVPLPVRHADEYDTGEENYDYEYESRPSRDDDSMRPRSSVPPAPPMREPVPAPPAVGVSRVKSVSWLRRSENNSHQMTCGDDNNGDGCTPGNVSPLPQSYFLEGCDTPPQTTVASPLRDREKTNLVEVVRGWSLKRRTPTPRQIPVPRNYCGEQNVAAPGCYAPGGCTQNTQTFPPHEAVRNSDEHSNPKTHGPRSGNLADPLNENGWEENAAHPVARGFTADELMELPSNLEQGSEVKPQSDVKPQTVPQVPDKSEIAPPPELPSPLPAPPGETVPDPVEQQINPNSVNSITKPPMWPRLGQPAAKPANLPVAAPMFQADSTLPLIQPGRGI